MNYFFDTHCHVMTLEHPNLVSFLNSLESGLPDFLISGALSTGYIMTGQNRKGNTMFTTVMNTLRAYEQPIGKTFALMEDDLAGKFTNRKPGLPYPEQPFFRDGKFHFRDREFDRVALCPLLMDFSITADQKQKCYYPPSSETKKIITYAEDTIVGIESYYQERKERLFDIFPLLGINPIAHDLDTIEKLLETYVVIDGTVVREKHTKKRFYGLKFYPPLGFDAWPNDKKERAKIKVIYEFCTKNNVPCITHCDDQGFRILPSKNAWSLTEPNHYRAALEEYPTLKIDFAHFGWQYSPQAKVSLSALAAQAEQLPSSPWFYQITELIKLFPNVYSDFSFSGTNPSFYTELKNYLDGQNEQDRKSLMGKMLFGSDYSINLLKMESYTEYYELFQRSPFSTEDILLFAHKNPLSFLDLHE